MMTRIGICNYRPALRRYSEDPKIGQVNRLNTLLRYMKGRPLVGAGTEAAGALGGMGDTAARPEPDDQGWAMRDAVNLVATAVRYSKPGGKCSVLDCARASRPML